MRIATHTALAFEPTKTIPEHVATRQPGSSSKPGATKPTFGSPAPTTTSDPFASVFQTFSQKVGASSTQSTATATITATTAASSASAAAPATTATATSAAASTTAAAAAATAADGAGAPVQNPGIQALVSAIMNGTFQATYVTDPSQLQETTPAGTDTMPNFYYASNQTANQLAQLLGGTVVQKPAFGQDKGWNEPLANFIQLPNGQTVNAADLAYYARGGVQGPAQLTADLTATINEGAAWSNWYQNGGQMPSFPTGYVGPPISGMGYPAGSIGADGNVINPAMQSASTHT